MEDKKPKFPKIKKSIENFIDDQDGNITRSKLVTIGTMVLLMSIVNAIDVKAAHGSHTSHESHSSTSYIRSHTNHGSHSNFQSHSDHGSHSSHASHTSHSNTAAHSNSLYSSEGDVSYGPSVSKISTVNNSPQSNATFNADPNVNKVDMSIPSIPDVPMTDDAPIIKKPE